MCEKMWNIGDRPSFQFSKNIVFQVANFKGAYRRGAQNIKEMRENEQKEDPGRNFKRI